MISLWPTVRLGLLAVILIATPIIAHAFKLDPYSNLDDDTARYEEKYFPPIHENLTLRAIAAAKINESYKTEAFITNIVKGVRWNDDPLSMAKDPVTFYASYTDSCSNPEAVDPDWDLLYRTHCGDMQFLHAMASGPSESAGTTRDKILMWVEFSFKVASGQIDKDWRFRSIRTFLDEGSAKSFNYFLTNNGTTRHDWQAEWLFTLDCKRGFTWKGLFSRARLTELSCADNNNRYSEQVIQDIALGSLLHVLQDSFSGSHLMREHHGEIGTSKLSGVGKVIQFGNHTMQDEHLHGKADRNTVEGDTTEGFALTEISARLIELAVQQRLDRQPKWAEAKEILNNAFEVVDVKKVSGAIGYK